MDRILVSLAALQHYAFCPRQCALIHNEQIWEENFFTAQGRILHERVDSGEFETRKEFRYERGVRVAGEKLGLIGKLDLLEVNRKSGDLKPVEYKRGRSKSDNWDRIQLCAQALCLEEMRGVRIDEGCIWYGKSRRRETVIFDNSLRQETQEVIERVRNLLESGKTPPPVYTPRCKSCSFFDNCQPRLLQKDSSSAYVLALFDEEGDA